MKTVSTILPLSLIKKYLGGLPVRLVIISDKALTVVPTGARLTFCVLPRATLAWFSGLKKYDRLVSIKDDQRKNPVSQRGTMLLAWLIFIWQNVERAAASNSFCGEASYL